MTYYEDNHVRIYNKDCRFMSELADGSVQCVVTSPPYWGLRKYSGEQELMWGGDACGHKWGNVIPNPMVKSGKHGPASILTKTADEQHAVRKESNQGAFCQICGAWKGAYGLEPAPEMYIQHTIEILREIRRVLRKDGIVFWNIGDSYWGGKGQSGQGSPEYQAMRQDVSLNKPYHQIAGSKKTRPSDGSHTIIKSKDLCLIPFRIAIAAQEDGWWVRSVIIWSKPNPMPESVTDRPTESHEYILMLTKSARYYWDQEAVREPSIDPESFAGRRPRQAHTMAQHDLKNYKFAGSIQPDGTLKHGMIYPNRNIRSVWEFPTQPYPEAHFAVFPEKLPEICIKAATPEVGCCNKCGAPWERRTEQIKTDTRPGRNTGTAKSGTDSDPNRALHQGDLSKYRQQISYTTIGWRPTCKCNAIKPPVPSLILDPFMGAGTTLWVAKKLNRRAVGYEISEEYCQLALDRNRQGVFNC